MVSERGLSSTAVPRVVLDSNIIISAYVFGGKPLIILQAVINEQIEGIISHVIIAEFINILRQKFKVSSADLKLFQSQIEDTFEVVNPLKTLQVLTDDPDNRVLEVAHEANCDYIITGDRDLLKLGKFEQIKIVSAHEFSKIINPL